MSFALSSAAAASVARVSSKATLRGRSLRAARSKATRPVRAMAVKAEVNQLKDGDKKGLVDSVETFIFDCDGVIWKGDSLIEGVPETIAMLREVAGKIPTFGICLGHQLLALALGARTWKLKFGHRGVNQPVRNMLTGRVEITSQNHGFVVERNSLPAGVVETHTSLFDNTVEGIRLDGKPVFSVQHHPEASPGPQDSQYLFDQFVALMDEDGIG